MKAIINFQLDKRRALKDKRYPVKLLVYDPITQKSKRYRTDFKFTENEFYNVWESKKIRKEFKDQNIDLVAALNHANQVAKDIIPFSFDRFELLFDNKRGIRNDIAPYYNKIILEFREQGKINTAEIYRQSLLSLHKFVNPSYHPKKDETPPIIKFHEITPKWLNAYKSFMEEGGRGRTTISIYLRSLRAVFNRTIEDKIISKEIYPFKSKNFKIPNAKRVKKALSWDQLKILYEAEPLTKEQEKAKDFWFISYACNGMNIKDILLLENRNVKDDHLVYYRAKTIELEEEENEIVVFLNIISQPIIEKYRTSSTDPNAFLFEILEKQMTPEQITMSIKKFTRFINQHIKKLAVSAELPEEISTYWARHSFSYNAINRKIATMEEVSEALDHSNLSTTKKYFKGFADEHKKNLSEKMVNFD